jgi:hypothetical protein
LLFKTGFFTGLRRGQTVFSPHQQLLQLQQSALRNGLARFQIKVRMRELPRRTTRDCERREIKRAMNLLKHSNA